MCKYTEEFAKTHIDSALRKAVWVNKAVFNYQTESWERRSYDFAMDAKRFCSFDAEGHSYEGRKWINRTDMIRDFERIPSAISDAELRGQVFNYFYSILSRPSHRAPSQKDRDLAAARTLVQFPQLMDYFIKLKEDTGDEAADVSAEKVALTKFVFEKAGARFTADIGV